MSPRPVWALRRLLDAAPAIPALIFHSVGRDNGHPLWRHLTLPVDVFEAQLAWLQRKGFRSVSLHDLRAHLKGQIVLPDRSIVLTFDDGFLDSWVYASPLLERYGFQATVFLCPAFVQAGTGTRPRAGRGPHGSTDPAEWWGYLRWDEVRAMQASGTFDLQAHGSTHRRHFTGPRIVDYLRPGTPHFWHRWNTAPERQPYSLSDPLVTDAEYGEPIYEHGQALLGPRYQPDPAVAEMAKALVQAEGGAAFFARPDWRTTLDEAVEGMRRARGERGSRESCAAYRDRVRRELIDCRTLLRRELGKPVDFLCWPANQDSHEAHALALDAGFVATTCLHRANVAGADPTRIGRTYFGQDEQLCRVGRPWLAGLRFQGTVQLASGHRAGYPKLFLANRLLAWYDRPAQQPVDRDGAHA